MLNSPFINHSAAGEGPSPLGTQRTIDELIQATLFGPAKALHDHDYLDRERHPVEDFDHLQSVIERWDYDKRIAEYIARAEQDGAFFLPETPQRVPRPVPADDQLKNVNLGVAHVAQSPLVLACAQVLPRSNPLGSSRMIG